MSMAEGVKKVVRKLKRAPVEEVVKQVGLCGACDRGINRKTRDICEMCGGTPEKL